MKNLTKTVKQTALVLATSAVMSGSVFAACSADINMNSNKITSLGAPTASTDAANKGYVDGTSITLTSTPDMGGATFTVNRIGGHLCSIGHLFVPTASSFAAGDLISNTKITGIYAPDGTSAFQGKFYNTSGSYQEFKFSINASGELVIDEAISLNSIKRITINAIYSCK